MAALFLLGSVAIVGLVVIFRASGEPREERAVLVGAGDIARCDDDGDEATGRLLEGIPGTVFTLGDNAYQRGSVNDFERCYDPSWGKHRARTRPAPGNHEYATPGAAGYFGYFGPSAGDREKGYYSYDLGAWHVVVLNSNCSEVEGGCAQGSPQEKWLRVDLERSRSGCTLAYFHHPRFSSGKEHGGHLSVKPFWRALYDHEADVVLSAHEHNYERFAPQTPGGEPDPTRGIRQFVVGTGGAELYGFGEADPSSQVRNARALGLLKMTLRPQGYSWEFVPVAGETFRDAGTDGCVS